MRVQGPRVRCSTRPVLVDNLLQPLMLLALLLLLPGRGSLRERDQAEVRGENQPR